MRPQIVLHAIIVERMLSQPSGNITSVRLISEVAEVFPDTPIVHPPAEVSARDNPDFVAAVKRSMSLAWPWR